MGLTGTEPADVFAAIRRAESHFAVVGVFELFDHTAALWEAPQPSALHLDLGGLQRLTAVSFIPETGWFRYERMPASFTVSTAAIARSPPGSADACCSACTDTSYPSWARFIRASAASRSTVAFLSANC